MNYYEHHIGDFDSATAHLSLVEDAIYRRLICLYYRNEAPITADVKQVCRLVRATSKSDRDTVASVLEEFFELHEDGWHNSRCDAEIRRYQAGEPEREAKKANEDARLKRHREERARLFQELAAVGQHAPWNVGMNELRALVKRFSQPLPATAPATPATATQTPDTRHQNTEIQRAATSTVAARAPEPEVQGHSPTAAGLMCRAMKAAGLADVNPGDPRLLALIEQGATEAEFTGAAAEAVKRGKGFAYALAALAGRRADAAQIALQPAADATPWHEGGRKAIEGKAAEFGIGPWNEVDEQWHQYRARVFRAAGHSPERTAA